MFFPAAIVVVEGKTDHEYIDRLLQLSLPGRKITVIGSGGDVKRKIAVLREAFGDLAKSPFQNRLFVVLDSVHQPGLMAELEGMGVQRGNIVIWERNGIEFLYPPTVLAEVFACPIERTGEILIDGDRVTLNGITKTKNELKAEVLKRMDVTIALPTEINTKLVSKVSDAIS